MGDGQSNRIRASAAIVRNAMLLVVETRDDNGERSTLPGGAVRSGEAIHDALQRELLEETQADIQVGRLLVVSECVPARDGNELGPHPEIDLTFACDDPLGS